MSETIETIYTGNKKTDEYLSKIFEILNELRSKLNKCAMKSDLIQTNKILNSIQYNGIYEDLTETNEKLQLKRDGASGKTYILIVEDPTEV